MRWPVLLAYASVIACGNKHSNDRQAPAASPGPVAPPGLAPQSTVAASCAKLVSQALVEKHLAGFAFDAMASSGLLASPGPATLCVFRKAGPPEADPVLATISFAPGDSNHNTEKLDAMVTSGAHEVSGIGRRAVRVANTIEFWSTHTSCVVALPADEQFAKDLDATLTPGSCPTTP